MCANFLGAHSRNTQSALTIAQQEISKLSVFRPERFSNTAG